MEGRNFEDDLEAGDSSNYNGLWVRGMGQNAGEYRQQAIDALCTKVVRTVWFLFHRGGCDGGHRSVGVALRRK